MNAAQKSPRKRTAAQKGYDLLCEAAGKIDYLCNSELLRIARAINSKTADYQTRLLVVEDFNWLNEPALSGSCHVCYSGCDVYMGRAVRALVFFREELLRDRSGRTTSDVRLVYEFPRSEEDSRKVWLDVATGLPWWPRSCQDYQRHLTEERRRELEALELAELKLARAELAKIEAEKCYTLFWQIDNERGTVDQFVEVLQELKRPHSKADWKVAREIAWRYHPSETPWHRGNRLDTEERIRSAESDARAEEVTA